VVSNVPNVAGKSKADIKTDSSGGKTNQSER
jgi:hypothetical protein